MAFEFSSRDLVIIEKLREAMESASSDTPEIKALYPDYIKMLKCHLPTLSKSIIFSNRYLVPQLTDSSQLQSLSTLLDRYVQGRGDTSETALEWRDAQKNIHAMLDDETIFNQSIARDNKINVDLYTYNFNTDDEDKFSAIQSINEIDDGSKPLFVENPLIEE